MNVFWADLAADQLAKIHEVATSYSTPYAERLIEHLTRAAERLGTFPHSGRIVPEFEIPGVREVIVPPYRLIDLVARDRVEIVSVFPSAVPLGGADLG